MDDAAVSALALAVRQGDRRALARALTIVENRWEGWLELMSALQAPSRRTKVIGCCRRPKTEPLLRAVPIQN